MKNRILPISLSFLFVVITSCFHVAAQQGKLQPKPKRERVMQLKIAYFTEQLALTTEQAEKFWPLYNEMNEKIREQKQQGRMATQSLQNNAETLTEEEFKQKTQKALNAAIEEAKLRKEYHEKIAAVIGYKKAAKLLSLEAQFKRELLKRLTEDDAPNTQDTND